MKIRYIRDGFHAITACPRVNDAAKLLDFAIKVFGANVESKTEGRDGQILNAEVRIDDSVLEVSDARKEWGAMPCALHVYVKDTDAVYQKALAAGAESLYEPADMPYGERSAGVKDQTGNHWYLATYTG